MQLTENKREKTMMPGSLGGGGKEGSRAIHW